MDSVMFFDSESKDTDRLDHISQRLLHVPIGHHYLLLYSDLAMIRKVYSKLVKKQLETQADSIIVILPFYENTEKVREVLASNDIDVKKLELDSTLIIVDILTVIKNQYYGVSDVERLRAFTKQIEKVHLNKTIFVIGDMSVFHLLERPLQLLEYERTLHKDPSTEKWKEICLYHKRDFESMFTEDQSIELLEYHKDRVIIV